MNYGVRCTVRVKRDPRSQQVFRMAGQLLLIAGKYDKSCHTSDDAVTLRDMAERWIDDCLEIKA